MEISRKEKFGTKKKTTKKWPKVVLATTIALGVGGTTTFAAANKDFSSYLYELIVSFQYKPEIDGKLEQKKETLTTNLKNDISKIFSDTKQELEREKNRLISTKEKELENHYKQEMAEITEKKNTAMTDKKNQMNNDASEKASDLKEDITEEIQKEIDKNIK
ncbi:hypothetical protein ACFW35_01645 [Fictibacillus sp. NPDC058756]|uniref:hypothetical protein n=1 Tax=Fictibacillus sp. NPDC058756 TaxID=3346625 RepID=UPI0036CBE75F